VKKWVAATGKLAPSQTAKFKESYVRLGISLASGKWYFDDELNAMGPSGLTYRAISDNDNLEIKDLSKKSLPKCWDGEY
jgi:hypothetical protein